MNRANSHPQVIALGKRLEGCPLVRTLGVRPNLSDYSREERALIEGAAKIYYPSTLYAELFHVLGKKTFPHYHNYLFVQDKIKQTAFFKLSGIPHPNTRVFYGKRQKQTILNYFDFPLIAKQPRGSARGRGIWLLRTVDQLESHCRKPGPVYIQEYLPIDRDLRIVVIGQKVRLAYWRVGRTGEYRNNIAAGGQIDFTAIPERALTLARRTARLSGWDDVGIDICENKGEFFVLEGNMAYGRQGFAEAGMDYLQFMTNLIRDGEI